jgi:hypothetical protein
MKYPTSMIINQILMAVSRVKSWDVGTNVRGELVFSVTTAGWFCEKSGWIGKVEDVKQVLLKKTIFQLATILRRRIFTWMNYEIGGFHPPWFI